MLSALDVLNQARKQARQICIDQGLDSPACRVARDTVEALRLELSHPQVDRQVDRLLKRTLAEHCEEFLEDSGSEFYDKCGR